MLGKFHMCSLLLLFLATSSNNQFMILLRLTSLPVVTSTVKYNATRLILNTPMTDHITPHLRTLHWFPVDAKIKYKFCSLCFGAITFTGPVDLSNLLKVYTSSEQLQTSADIRILCIPSVDTTSYDEHSFSYTTPLLWNTLPKDVRFSLSASSFRSALKTHLFPT